MSNLQEASAAVIGAGFIGAVHIEALRRLGVRVTGLLGSTPDRGKARALQLGVPRAYANLDELLADDRVTVVHVTSPNEFHYPQVKAVLGAGRHVICEKPLAMTSSESAELLQLASARDLVAATNFNLRFYPLNLHAAHVVRGGDLGEVRLVSGRYFQDWLLYDSDWNWRLEADRGGKLRAVADIGSHWLDLTGFITGLRVEAVMADLATFIPVRLRPRERAETFGRASEVVGEPIEITTEDVATILLRFEGGARGAVAISQISAGRKNGLQYEIDAATASMAWDSEEPERLWIGHRDRPNEILLRDPATLQGAGSRLARLPAGHTEGFADTFVAIFTAIYEDVVVGQPSDRPLYPTFAAGHEAMLLADAVAESAAAGRWSTIARPEPTAPPATATERRRA